MEMYFVQRSRWRLVEYVTMLMVFLVYYYYSIQYENIVDGQNWTIDDRLIVLNTLKSHNGRMNHSIPRACSENYRERFLFCNESLPIDIRVLNLISYLGLQEKALLLTARESPSGDDPSIGLSEYDWGANCIHGVQSRCGNRCPTSFPNPVNFGATFNMDLVKKMAQVIGVELRALWLEGIGENHGNNQPHLGLDCWSPNININRDPRWGRNLETPSEDPLINSLYGVEYTKGLQEGRDRRYLQAVVTLKHWVAYSLESYGQFNRFNFDAKVSNYDFADTYFPAFKESIVKGNAKGIMCAYNSINGVPACANKFLYDVLRKSWKFDGYSTSDTEAVKVMYTDHHFTSTYCEAAKIAIENGTDINSGNVYRSCLDKLYLNKSLEMTTIDQALFKTLKLRFELGLFDDPKDQPYWHISPNEVRTNESIALSISATRESIVLLKNRQQTLPLRKGTNIAVIGPHCNAREVLLGNYIGQICKEGFQKYNCVESPVEAIKRFNAGGNTLSARGCDVSCRSTNEFSEALVIAKRSDAVIMFMGIDLSIEREGLDRTNITLPGNQIQLFHEIKKLGRPVTVVLINGGALAIEELKKDADAIVEAFYPGVYGSQVIAEILFGDYNPGGKLPVTFYPLKYISQSNMYSMDMTLSPGRSYKYYSGTPIYPFGWGLSYTTFNFTWGNVFPDVLENDIDMIMISIEVMNTGNVSGDETVLAYFKPKDVKINGPSKYLKRQLFEFKRIHLEPQGRQKVYFKIMKTTFALVDSEGNRVSAPGLFQVEFTNGVNVSIQKEIEVKGILNVQEYFPHNSMHTMDKKQDVE